MKRRRLFAWTVDSFCHEQPSELFGKTETSPTAVKTNKRSRCKQGTLEFEAHFQDYPAGPNTWEELFTWSTQELRQKLEARPSMISNIQALLCAGEEGSNAYAGVAFDLEARRLLQEGLSPYMKRWTDDWERGNMCHCA